MKIKAGANQVMDESPNKKLNRSFKRQVGNQVPLTVDELVRKSVGNPF